MKLFGKMCKSEYAVIIWLHDIYYDMFQLLLLLLLYLFTSMEDASPINRLMQTLSPMILLQLYNTSSLLLLLLCL